MIEKKCFKCELVKPLSEFYKHSQMADGHLNKCKECNKKDATDHRWNNIDKIREYDRNRGSRQDAQYLRDYRAKYPNKYNAHRLVNKAIKTNKLFKEKCSSCSSNFAVEAHHDDYLKPLNIRWLCSCCHKQWHRDNGEGANPF